MKYDKLKFSGVAGIISVLVLVMILFFLKNMAVKLFEYQNYGKIFGFWFFMTVVFVISYLFFLYGFVILAGKVKNGFLKVIVVLRMLFVIVAVLSVIYVVLKISSENYPNIVIVIVLTSLILDFVFGVVLISLRNIISFGILAGIIEMLKIVGLWILFLFPVFYVLSVVVEVVILFRFREEIK